MRVLVAVGGVWEMARTRTASGWQALMAAAVAMVLVSAGWVPALAGELVVDNADDSVAVRGEWISSSLTEGFYGADYRFRVAGDGSASVTWPFPASAPGGQYEVFARWTSGANRASNAPYTVAHADGSTDVLVNQRTDGGTWRSLGTFTWQPGQDHGVTLSDLADGVVIADAVRWVGPMASGSVVGPTPTATPAPASSPIAAPSPTAPAAAQGSPDAAAPWTVTLEDAAIHAGPGEANLRFGTLPQFSYLQVLGYDGEWAYVYNPRARGTGYVRSNQLGPGDPPPAWLTAPPPPAIEPVNALARTVGAAPLAFYPVADPWAVERRLGHNTSVLLKETVRGEDGETWYRLADGGYLPAASVRLPAPPPTAFAGRWLDADLSEPALLTAYEGDVPVRTMLVVKGRVASQTPTGVFRIQRRVANETMNSETLIRPIPRNAPGGYYLTNVLYTQYFLPTGESIHYNYWNSNFGYAGSNGCLGLNYEDSAWVWEWASLGTPVSIHY